MSPDDWEARLTHLVAREVRRHRERRRLSQQLLADRTAELGLPLPRPVLANLERGRRDTVSAAEVLVLAAALGVSPMELICPVGYDSEIEILPGRKMDPLQASRWVDGELALDATGRAADVRSPSLAERSGIGLIEEHTALLDQVNAHEAAVLRSERNLDLVRSAIPITEAMAAIRARRGDDHETATKAEGPAADRREEAAAAAAELAYRVAAAEQYQVVAAQSLRPIRAEMRRRGMILPPLPPSLQDAADDPQGDAR